MRKSGMLIRFSPPLIVIRYQILMRREARHLNVKKAQNTHGYSPSDSAATTSWSLTAGARCSSPFDLNFKFNNIIRNPHHNLSISRPMFRDCLDMCKLSHRLKKDMAHSNKCLSRSILEYKVCGNLYNIISNKLKG